MSKMQLGKDLTLHQHFSAVHLDFFSDVRHLNIFQVFEIIYTYFLAFICSQVIILCAEDNN